MPKKVVRFHADVIQAMSLGSSDNSMEPDDPFYDRRLFAEGDAIPIEP